MDELQNFIINCLFSSSSSDPPVIIRDDHDKQRLQNELKEKEKEISTLLALLNDLEKEKKSFASEEYSVPPFNFSLNFLQKIPSTHPRRKFVFFQ
jgi:hypothetical protein